MSFPVILITSPEDFADELVLLEAMFARGLQRLHLRKPSKDLSSMRRWLLGMAPEFYARIVVHGHAQLVEDFSLAGSHGAHAGACSFSAHGADELAAAEGYSYAFLSPVFDSYSKHGYKSAFSQESLTDIIRTPYAGVKSVYALGGVDADRLATVREMGFSGAAALGAVWNAPDPLGAWESLYERSFEVCGEQPPPRLVLDSWRDYWIGRRGIYEE